MNTDLENTLAGLGADYFAMVERLKAPFEEKPRARRSSPVWLMAASLLVAALAAVAVLRPWPAAMGRRAAPGEYMKAYRGADVVEELLSTQNPDGSWQSDYLTRQNAAALKDVANASVAYRKALRYLRSRGLAPLSDEEFRRRAVLASNRG